MQIALFSDIHANLPAFEAFLKDLDRRKPDAVYCLGDLVGYHIWPNEVIDEIRKRGIATLAGNHDLKVKGLFTTKEALNQPGKEYAYHLISDTNRVYLSSLPAHIRLEFQSASGPWAIMIAHGSTRSVDEYILADTDETYVQELMAEAKADILCVGHSHKPYHRILRSKGGIRHVINIGSVGKPKDGNPKGCYVLLKMDDGLESLQVEFVRIAYDVELAATALEASLLPAMLADQLRKAY